MTSQNDTVESQVAISNRIDGCGGNGSRLITGFLPASLAFFISAAFVPGLTNAATSPRWVLAGLSCYFLSLPALLFAAYVLYFLTSSPDAAFKWAIVAAAFCWGQRIDDETAGKVAEAFAAGILVSGVVATIQWFGYEPVARLPNNLAGLFINKNYMGEAACVAFILGMRFSIVAMLASVPALVLSGSRASWLAALIAFGINAEWRWTWGWLITGAVLAWSAGWLGDGTSMDQRFELWRDATPVVLAGLPFGAGAPWEPLHNEFLQTFSELGVAASVPLVALYLAASRDLAFGVGVAVLLSLGFSLHLPATAWLIAFMCGHLVGNLRHDGRDRVRPARLEAGAAVVPALRA